MTNEEIYQCASCGYHTSEPYCPECGQRKQNRFTIKYILGELLALLSYDKGYLYNFFYLTFSPAKTLQEYLNGKTKNFYTPLPYFMSALTVLFLLVSLAAHHIDLRFSKKLVFVIEDASVKNYFKEQEYIAKKKQRQDTIAVLLKDGEDTYFTTEKYDSLWEQTFNMIFEAEQHQEFVIDVAERDIKASQYVSYAMWYLLPFYLTIYSSLFYRKSKLFFTEHLVLQLFILGQIFWFIIFAILIALGFSWIYTQIYEIPLPEKWLTLQLGLVYFAMLYSIGYIFYVYWHCYQQHWAWLVLKLPIQLFLLFATMFMAAAFTSVYFKGSF